MNKHRVFAVDGSKLNLPKELETDNDYNYKVNNKGAHYPQGLLSCIYNLTTYIIHDFCLSDKMDERICAQEHLKILREDDVVIYDRGYFSYYMLHEHYNKKIYPIFRLQKGLQNKAIEDFIASNEEDRIIIYSPFDTVKYDLKKKGINIDIIPIKIRLIKYQINNEIYIIGTTL